METFLAPILIVYSSQLIGFTNVCSHGCIQWGWGRGPDRPPLENHKWLSVLWKHCTEPSLEAIGSLGSICFEGGPYDLLWNTVMTKTIVRTPPPHTHTHTHTNTHTHTRTHTHMTNVSGSDHGSYIRDFTYFVKYFLNSSACTQSLLLNIILIWKLFCARYIRASILWCLKNQRNVGNSSFLIKFTNMVKRYKLVEYTWTSCDSLHALI